MKETDAEFLAERERQAGLLARGTSQASLPAGTQVRWMEKEEVEQMDKLLDSTMQAVVGVWQSDTELMDAMSLNTMIVYMANVLCQMVRHVCQRVDPEGHVAVLKSAGATAAAICEAQALEIAKAQASAP